MDSELLRRKLEVLKAETNLSFPMVVRNLEDGARLVFIAEDDIGKDLTPEQLRGIGALVKVCGVFGATVMFSRKQYYAIFDH